MTFIKTDVIVAPASGAFVALADVADPLFACGAAGDGCGISPTSGEVAAPVSGMVMTIADAEYAVAIRTDDGVDVLVHVGLGTNLLEGRAFDARVQVGEQVSAGQPLVDVNLDAILAAGCDPTVLVLVTDLGLHHDVTPVAAPTVRVGEPLLRLS